MKQPFLQNGSDVEGCDDAVLDLIELADKDFEAFREIAELIAASLSKAREQYRADIRRTLETYARSSPKKSPIPADIRWAVWERDNFTCRHCGSRKNLTVDHIFPESKGGEMTMENAQTLCKTCNSRKGAR